MKRPGPSSPPERGGFPGAGPDRFCRHGHARPQLPGRNAHAPGFRQQGAARSSPERRRCPLHFPHRQAAGSGRKGPAGRAHGHMLLRGPTQPPKRAVRHDSWRTPYKHLLPGSATSPQMQVLSPAGLSRHFQRPAEASLHSRSTDGDRRATFRPRWERHHSALSPSSFHQGDAAGQPSRQAPRKSCSPAATSARRPAPRQCTGPGICCWLRSSLSRRSPCLLHVPALPPLRGASFAGSRSKARIRTCVRHSAHLPCAWLCSSARCRPWRTAQPCSAQWSSAGRSTACPPGRKSAA